MKKKKRRAASMLQHELLVEVFKGLSPSDLGRACVVCKEWRHIISSNRLIEATGPWVFLKRSYGTNICFSLKFGPQFLIKHCVQHPFETLVANGDKVCIDNGSGREIMVGNPVTDKWKYVLPLSVRNVNIVFKEYSGGCMVCLGKGDELFLHDSNLPGVWQRYEGSDSAEKKLCSVGAEEYSNGDSSRLQEELMWGTFKNIKAFDPQAHVWWMLDRLVKEDVHEDDPVWRDCTYHENEAVQTNGRFFLVQYALNNDRNMIGYSVWELVASVWSRVSRFLLPNSNTLRWAESSLLLVSTCAGFILITIQEIEGWHGAWPAVIYNVESGEWSTISHPGIAYHHGSLFMPALH